MGISESKQPKTPIRVHILLEKPQTHLYRPREEIRGVVELTTSKPVMIPLVSIHIICESSVHLRIGGTQFSSAGAHGEPNSYSVYEHFKHYDVLLNKGHLVFSQRDILRPGQPCRIRFAFPMPGRTNGPCPQDLSTRSSRIWTLHQHDLPPSCPLDNPIKSNLDKFGVDFSLQAVLHSEHYPDLKGAWRRPIRFCPLSPYTGPATTKWTQTKCVFHVRSSLLKTPPGIKLPLRQRARDVFSSNTPHAEFTVVVDIPGQVTAGVPFKCRITVSAGNKSEPDLRFPPIHFRVEHIFLGAVYHVRAVRDEGASSG